MLRDRRRSTVWSCPTIAQHDRNIGGSPNETNSTPPIKLADLSGRDGQAVPQPEKPEKYEAIFGPGGARHPQSGERLVSARRPEMELVISAHESVAELGVIGRAEHMGLIVDAERDATTDYLDELTRSMGGRQGRCSACRRSG